MITIAIMMSFENNLLFNVLNLIWTAGVVDQDYRGNVGVVMFNFAENEFEGKK